MWAGVAGKQDRMEGKNQKGETRMKVKKWKGQLWLKIVTLIVALLHRDDSRRYGHDHQCRNPIGI